MDIADKIDDYICTFEAIGDFTMDSLAIFIFLWAIFSLLLIWMCKFLYQKYFNNKINTTSNPDNQQTNEMPGLKFETRKSEPRESSTNKTDFKDFLNKSHGGRPPANATALRRRVVRQTSVGPENKKKRYVPPPSSVVGPETTSVTWTSQVFRWLYSDLVIVNELLIVWIMSLNENLRRIEEKNGPIIDIIRVLPESPPPWLTNIFCNSEPENPSNMVVSFDCDATPVFQVKTSRHKNGKLETSHYKVTVSRFKTRVSCKVNYNSLKGEIELEGYPDIRLNMNSVGVIKLMDQEEKLFQTHISERIENALRDTIYPVDFSMYSTCPRGESDPKIMPSNVANSLQDNEQKVSVRRLLVKIVRGEDIKNAKNPYVIVEMDEPAQKNQTLAKSGPGPLWDEHFLFELNLKSAEILFEVYDRDGEGKDKFLGLGLVGINEIGSGLASTQKFMLQPKPYETQDVSGSITVDFVFIDGAEIPLTEKPLMPFARKSLSRGMDVNDSAVRVLEDRLPVTDNGKMNNIFHHNYDPPKDNEHAGLYVHNGHKNGSANPNTDEEFEKRGRSKKRNFFGTLKKRLSKSKHRAQSTEHEQSNMHIESFNGRSLSVDRATGSNNNLKPGLSSSRRSSISELSAISAQSSASTKTYVHEASTLVLETMENGIKRHFIVPLAIAQQPKWRRKGTKLHIYNDHTFIAKHLSGGALQCNICMKSIPRRPGKQGYNCRDCNLTCHKQCHVRAPQACPNPTILSMELSKLSGSLADRNIRKL